MTQQHLACSVSPKCFSGIHPSHHSKTRTLLFNFSWRNRHRCHLHPINGVSESNVHHIFTSDSHTCQVKLRSIPPSKWRSSDKRTASLGQDTFVCSRERMCITIRLELLLPQPRTSLCSLWWWGQGEQRLRLSDGTIG